MKYIGICYLLILAYTSSALAQDGTQQKDDGFWYVQTSVYTRHFSPDPEHNNNQDLIGIRNGVMVFPSAMVGAKMRRFF